ncbi:MAG: reverse gyrase [Candidatus Micrarchaeota archaeon]|nr:MAG: reverse gyrase [Candidatus Micrarchaeota archaeon]
MKDIDAIYASSCPNCGRDIEAERMIKGLPCKECLPDSYIKDKKIISLEEVIRYLEAANRLNGMRYIKDLMDKRAEMEKLFKEILSSKPTGIQRLWINKLLTDQSFTLNAPTGSGKTTFGIISSLFMLLNKKRTLFIVATKLLAKQIYDRLLDYSSKISKDPRIYISTDKNKLKEALSSNSFDILIVTSKFLIRNIDLFNGAEIDLYFLDDVDSFAKSKRATSLLVSLYKSSSKKKQIVLSSATIRKASLILLKELGFMPGSSSTYMRNVLDSYVIARSDTEIADYTERVISSLGAGGLILYNPYTAKEELIDTIENRVNKIYKAKRISSTSSIKDFQLFADKQLDILIGSASHYGILVRGIDLPERLRYIVFIGAPSFTFKIGDKPPPALASILLERIIGVVNDNELRRTVYAFNKYIKKMSNEALRVLYDNIKNNNIDNQLIKKTYEYLDHYIKQERIQKELSKLNDFTIEGDRIRIADTSTYIQATGRISRILNGPLTFGLSVIIEKDKDIIRQLESRLSFIIDDLKLEELDIDNLKVDGRSLKEISLEIDRSRAEQLQAISDVKSTLFIVESPNKARVIANFFSKPSVYRLGNALIYETSTADNIVAVIATLGHIYELTTKDLGFYGVILENNSYYPYYETIKRCERGHQITTTIDNRCSVAGCNSKIVYDKRELVDIIRRYAALYDEVIIGTDPDSEGEKIAFDVLLTVYSYNRNIHRSEFHEVTRKAILAALNNLKRDVELNLVKAQILRRIDDRWVGFKLSEILKERFSEDFNLSAGRVQTPVLGWIIDAYNRYKKDKHKVAYINDKELGNLQIDAEGLNLNKGDIVSIEVRELNRFKNELDVKPPYTTDAMLSDAVSILNISAAEAMKAAQSLFESGLITYHRTDSTRISSAGISILERFIDLNAKDLKKHFKADTWSKEGAHEAIRPTKPLSTDKLLEAVNEGELNIELDKNQIKLYDLIFKRALTSQLSNIYINKVRVVLSVCNKRDNRCIDKEVLIDESISPEYLKDYMRFIYLNTRLKRVSIDTGYKAEYKISKLYMISKHRLYTQADLVKLMKSKQIGRPSTYASTISTLMRRRYVIESKSSKSLIPSNKGITVYSYISKYSDFVSEETTKKLLELMDLVEEGRLDYKELLNDIYQEINKIS